MFLGYFWPDITSKKFKNNIFRLNSTRAIDWCINCHLKVRKKIYSIFHYKGGPLPKKSRTFFSARYDNLYINRYQSMWILNFFEVIFGQK